VRIELHRHVNAGVSKDRLDGGRVGSGHDQQRRGRVPRIVKSHGLYLAHGPKFHSALRASTQVSILGLFAMATSLATTLVDESIDDARFSQGGAKDRNQVQILRVPTAIGTWKY
jgi:hypothetical protein